MKGLKTHIAILFFGIFIFPLAYQPWHVIQHQTRKMHCHHGCCSYYNHHHDEKAKHGCKIELEKESPCPICEYHFPNNIAPKYMALILRKDNHQRFLLGLKTQLPFSSYISKKSPRAPPFCKPT